MAAASASASSEVVFKHYPPCLQNHGHHHHHASTISMSLMKSSSESSSLLLLRRSPSLSSSSSSSSSSWLSRNNQFYGGQRIIQQQQGGFHIPNPQASNSQIQIQMMMMSGSGSRIGIGKAQKWWEKGVQPNMIEISSAQHLVDSLSKSGDQLVVLAFFSPGCGGCKALHPKLCQLAEMNPDVQFLQVNYEEHKSMCYSLNVHVLPFFRFYRGAHGRLTSFSCTNATIKKFKDALAKHSPDRCSLGPAKGLEEKELLALSANKDLCFTYTPKPVEAVPVEEDKILAETSSSTPSDHSNTPPPLPLPHPHPHPHPHPSTTLSRESEDKTLVVAWR